MPAALSKSTRSFTTMRPASGRLSPARQSSVAVLPAPEGPKSPVTRARACHDTSSVKPGNRLLTSMAIIARSVPQADDARQSDEEEDDRAERDQRERVGLRHLVGLHVIVDGQGQRLRPA